MFTISVISAFVLASSQQVLAQSCSGFNVTTSYADLTYTSLSSRSYIISEGVSCPAAQNCSVDIGGYVTDGRTLNISDDASADSIYDTISKVVNLQFNETQTYPVALNHGPWTIKNGTDGYVVFTPNTRCATGRLSGCQGNNLEGQIVSACALEGEKYGDGLSGVINEVVTDRETVANLTCNPSNTTQAKNGNYTGGRGCTGTQDETGAAGTVGGASLALLSVSMLVAFVGF
ncbi:hypothetical protein KCU81_g3054, partial [Aureobasidium melanogenum]|uniref:Uncharacterized protein n=1 Tax=Aureobasidium melanogenum (strain CBS 110374) TaxID=1043003 RepID=A0A074VCB4_AURM1